MELRLNKYISESGFASRRKAEEFIEQGRVMINGKVVTNLATKVDPYSDEVYIDDVKLKIKEKVYFLLNKPKGFITSTSDEKSRKTVVDLIRTKEKIFPVGRLDYNTTGVLLLTNDGELANKITHPKNNFKRVYVARIDKDLSELDKDKLLTGVYFEKRKGVFTELSYVKDKSYKIVRVSVMEGRNHFVKRMFSALGYRVIELDRESFGGITVKGLNPGDYKTLTFKEIEKLIQK